MKNYYLGGDVSKGYCDFSIMDQEKEIVEKSFQLDDTKSGHKKLHEIIANFFKNNPEATLYCAFESTGSYENNWISAIQELRSRYKIHVARLNAYGVNHSGKAGLLKVSNDKICGRLVAEYQIKYRENVRYDVKENYITLRKLFNTARLQTKQKTQFQNQLEKLLYQANPELLNYCKSGMPNWIKQLLKYYPTSMKLSRASALKLSKIPYISKEKAQKLIAQAKNTVASNVEENMGELIIVIVEQILNLEKQKEKLLSLISQEIDKNEVELLKSFTGISDYSATGLLLEIGDINRFPASKNLVSYFGLNPSYRESGDGKYEIRMSKKGRKVPREILYMVALSAISKNPYIKKTYENFMGRGMNAKAAIGAIMHKITRIIYAMLKNKEKYDPAKYQERTERKELSEKKEEDNSDSRRYLSYDENAPISGRQRRKRKEMTIKKERKASSQKGITDMTGIGASAP